MNWPDSSAEVPNGSTESSDPRQGRFDWWRGLDTDWKSVFVAAVLVAVSITTDVPVPA